MEKKPIAIDDKLHWYKDAIIYELHIKAFRDGNGDGIGDFQGLLEKLDYIRELGVTAIWLLPFYPSPLKDDGYDIADYYSIHPSYGTIEEFKLFLDEAHKRNLKVITELVINHTSDQHPWFQRARNAPKGSPERDYYVWTDNPDQYKDVRIIFQDFEGSNWSWDPVAQQYYWHRFFYHQPDLNYDNPQVQEEVFKMIDYWCAMGVDGFRLDAVPYLYEREGTNGENLPETHAFLKNLRTHVDENFPGTLLLAEANMWPEDSASYFGNGDECHMNYHFPLMPRIFMALQMEDRYPVTDIFDQTPAIPATCQWAIFLRNHDELTLEMVTDEERDYMYKVYAKDLKARINLGIRHRLAPLMDNNFRKIELLNCLLFSLPGTPVIYYGDEIGMGDNFYLGDRDGVRTPMQWSSDRNAGFSNANPQRLYLPLILDPQYNYEAVNVEAQRSNTSSLFWFMKRMIVLRKKYKAFGRGDMNFLHVSNAKVLAFTRSYEEETLLILVNLSKYPQPAEVELKNYKGYVPVEIAGRSRFPAIQEDGYYFFSLGPYAFQAFALQKSHADQQPATLLPALSIEKWDELMMEKTRLLLENYILPDYFLKSKWFTSDGRLLSSIQILDYATLPLPGSSAYILLLEVQYESGLPEHYQLMLTWVKQDLAAAMEQTDPQAVISQIKVGEQNGVLCDAVYVPEVLHALLVHLAGNRELKDGHVVFYSDAAVKKYLDEQKELKARIYSGNPCNTSVGYNSRFFLKLYRKVDTALNADVEITRFLEEKADFKYVPAFLGAIEWNLDKGRKITLGMLQEMIENHGNGHSYMLERLNNFIERILAGNGTVPEKLQGTLTEPLAFEQLPEDLKELLGARTAEQARLIGARTGAMHKALASGSYDKDFAPEAFSLHYQRSLFASMQSLVRKTFQELRKEIPGIREEVQQELQDVLNRKYEVLDVLKRIYKKKLDAVKMRTHGDYHLGQVLLTGKDVAITDFGGDPYKTYSERRLKKSPLRDVVTMLRSFYYAAYEGIFLNSRVPQEEVGRLVPYARLWAHYIGVFFMQAYLEEVAGSSFIPAEKEDLRIMLQTFLLEKSLSDLNHERHNRPEWMIVPLRMVQAIVKQA